MARLCLNMIVKDEAANLDRCLRSVADHIACWVICDTGSTDGTPERIEAFFASRGIPGELHRFPFRTFEQARNEALERARTARLAFDYLLLMDADMEFVLRAPGAFEALREPAYMLRQLCGISYWNVRLLKRDAAAVYRGVTHEYLDIPDREPDHFHGAEFVDHADGANRPGKYARDAALLRAGIAAETDPWLLARYTYYLANSLRDGGDAAGALEVYGERVRLGGWAQEVFMSLLGAARLREELGHPTNDVLAAYEAAAEACPSRLEALHGAARHCRLNDLFERGYAIAARGLHTPMPDDALFREDWIYRYGLLDEFSINAYWAGRYGESVEACLSVLERDDLPSEDRTRVAANARFALAQLTDSDATRRPPEPPSDETEGGEPHAPGWRPQRAQGGTELMVEGLHARLGSDLDAIDLRVNLFDAADLTGRPLVVWIHHDIDQEAVQWLRDRAMAARVDRFVFVSDWQRQRFVGEFGLAPAICSVLRNATEVDAAPRSPPEGRAPQLAYTSVPYRGLSVLLDAWERLGPVEADLHVWSSHTLYGPASDDAAYRALYARARALPRVRYHGIVPNPDLREALRAIDILAYPSIFAETSCLAAIEALAAGVRVVCPDLGALPETTGGFARIYPFRSDPDEHARAFADILGEEIGRVRDGEAERVARQQAHARAVYDWPVRVGEWRALLATLAR